MTVIEHLVLVTPTEGAAPSLPTGWANTGSGTQFEVRAAAAFTPDAWGLRLPAMSTSFRRLEYTFSDGAQSSGFRCWSAGINPTTFSGVNTFIASMVNTAGTGQWDIRFNTSGTSRTITVRNIANANATATGTATYSTGSQVRFEMGITIGGNLELRTYAWGSGTLIESITLAATSITQITKAYLGVTAAAASWAADYGLPTYANDWLTAADAGTGSLTLSASGTSAALGGAAGTASLTLSGSGLATVADAGTASLTLSASGSSVAAPRFTFVPKYPVTAAHRGGYPNAEETFEAYDATLALVPDAALEYDCQDLSDGALAASHDDTVDRTADASSPITTGSIASLTTAQWHTVILTPQGAGVTGHGRTVADLAGRYPTQLHMPEIKTGADYVAAVAQFISLGLDSHSIVQSFSYTAATYAASQGLEVVYEMAGGDSHTFSQMKAAGINHVMRNKTLWTTGDITAAKAAGLKTWIFTVDTTAERDTWLANGIDGGFISGQPATTHMTDIASGSLTLSASGLALAAEAGSASLTLSGGATARVQDAGTASLSLSGGGVAASSEAATGALSLSGAGTASAPDAGTGSLTLSGTGTSVAPGGAAGTGSLTLSGAGASTTSDAGTASLALTATGTDAARAAATGSLTLSGSGADAGAGAGSGALTLFAAAVARAAEAGLAVLTLTGGGTVVAAANGGVPVDDPVLILTTPRSQLELAGARSNLDLIGASHV